MIKVSLKEAEGRLGRLIDEAAAGQEVVIERAGGRTVHPEIETGPEVGEEADATQDQSG